MVSAIRKTAAELKTGDLAAFHVERWGGWLPAPLKLVEVLIELVPGVTVADTKGRLFSLQPNDPVLVYVGLR